MTNPFKDSKNRNVTCSELLSQSSHLLDDWKVSEDLKSRWSSEVLELSETNSRGLNSMKYFNNYY